MYKPEEKVFFSWEPWRLQAQEYLITNSPLSTFFSSHFPVSFLPFSWVITREYNVVFYQVNLVMINTTGQHCTGGTKQTWCSLVAFFFGSEGRPSIRRRLACKWNLWVLSGYCNKQRRKTWGRNSLVYVRDYKENEDLLICSQHMNSIHASPLSRTFPVDISFSDWPFF